MLRKVAPGRNPVIGRLDSPAPDVLELGLRASSFVCRVVWVPGSAMVLMTIYCYHHADVNGQTSRFQQTKQKRQRLVNLPTHLMKLRVCRDSADVDSSFCGTHTSTSGPSNIFKTMARHIQVINGLPNDQYAADSRDSLQAWDAVAEEWGNFLDASYSQLSKARRLSKRREHPRSGHQQRHYRPMIR